MYYEDGDRGSSRKYYERGTYGPYKVGKAGTSSSGPLSNTSQRAARALTD